MREVVGAIHLHSCYSDGSGTLREITAAAARAGIDFLVLADHDTLAAARDGWQGWHDGVLVVVGAEITCRDHSHVVALNATDVEALRFKPLRRVLFDLTRQGAVPIVAHAHPARIMGYPLKAGELSDWEVPGFAGVELWSFMHDICHGLTPWRIPSFLQTWRQHIRGPHPDTVAHWDRITQDRAFAAIGSLDNHAIAVPVLGKRVLPYEDGFRTLRTHAFCDRWSGEPGDADRLVDALRRGRCFIALDLEADARGFRFEAERGGEVLGMGEERPWQGPAVLRARSPAPAHLVLLRNGERLAEADGTSIEHRAEEPGVYRVEARIEDRPWVYTNPIYLRPGRAADA